MFVGNSCLKYHIKSEKYPVSVYSTSISKTKVASSCVLLCAVNYPIEMLPMTKANH